VRVNGFLVTHVATNLIGLRIGLRYSAQIGNIEQCISRFVDNDRHDRNLLSPEIGTKSTRVRKALFLEIPSFLINVVRSHAHTVV